LISLVTSIRVISSSIRVISLIGSIRVKSSSVRVRVPSEPTLLRRSISKRIWRSLAIRILLVEHAASVHPLSVASVRIIAVAALPLVIRVVDSKSALVARVLVVNAEAAVLVGWLLTREAAWHLLASLLAWLALLAPRALEGVVHVAHHVDGSLGHLVVSLLTISGVFHDVLSVEGSGIGGILEDAVESLSFGVDHGVVADDVLGGAVVFLGLVGGLRGRS
jgi:hypothetical protein